MGQAVVDWDARRAVGSIEVVSAAAGADVGSSTGALAVLSTPAIMDVAAIDGVAALVVGAEQVAAAT